MRSNPQHRIIIAVPYLWLRETISHMMSDLSAEIESVSSLEDLKTALQRPSDALIIDVFGFQQPHNNLLEMIRLLAPSTAILALLSSDTVDYRDAVVHAGANAVIIKENAYDELIPGIAGMLKGRRFNTYITRLLEKHKAIIEQKEKKAQLMDKENKSSGQGLSRRTFLGASGTVAAGTALAAAKWEPLLNTLEEIGAQSALAQTEEQVFQSFCRPNCVGYCRLNVHVRNGKAVKISMAPFPDSRYNRMCLRGLSHVQRIYDPDRILYPMKRAGERGENKWERITWDEAIGTISGEFKRLQEEYGKQAVAFISGSGNISLLNGSLPGMGSRFQNLIGATAVESCTDSALPWGMGRVTGSGGFITNEPADWANAKVIILWGFNVTEAAMHDWHFIAEGMEKGAKLVVIDPNYTSIASKADLYVSCRPGSDPALILSLIQVIIAEELYDRQYVLDHTVGPFLVREDTKKFLRMSDLGVEPTEGPPDARGNPTVIDPAAVWDEAQGAAVPVGEVSEPALFGTFETNGFTVRPAFALLKEEADNYAPESASDLTEVDPQIIRQLAQLASEKPVANLAGFGPQAYDNGVMVGHALGALAGITGNIGISGGTTGYLWQTYAGINYNVMFPTFEFGPRVPNLALREVVKSGEFQGQPFPIKSLFVSYGNPFSNYVNQKELLEEVLPKLDLVVVSEMAYTTTARYADIVLPVPHWFEEEDIGSANAQHPFVQFAEKCIEPPGECKRDSEIFRLLAEQMGIGEYFSMSDEEYINEVLNTPYSAEIGLNYQSLREQGAIRVWKDDPFIPFAGGTFPTASGRMEFYVENPTPRVNYGQEYDADRERLPRFFPPAEAWPDNENYTKYPLVLLSQRPRFRVHGQWFNTPWLRELDPEPLIYMNPVDALARGITNGDIVETYNDRGHAVSKLILSEGIRPGVLNYIRGWQKHQMIAGDFQELTGTLIDPVGVNQSFMDALVEVRKWDGEV